MTRSIKTLWLAGCAVMALTGAAHADTIAITGGRVITNAGAPIDGGTVVIRDGRITAVGKDVTVPKDATVIDATGKVVTPGLIATDAGLGFTEVDSLGNELGSGNSALSASFDVSYGFNPQSQRLPVARLGGLTRAIVLPLAGQGGGGNAHRDDGGDEHDTGGNSGGNAKTAGLFGGLAAVVDLSGSSEKAYKTSVAEVVDLGSGGAAVAGGSRASAITLFKAALADARHYAKNRAVYARGEGRELSLSTPDLEALVPVIEGRRLLVVNTDSATDILKALDVAASEKIRIAIKGGAEAWQVAAKLAANNTPVIIDAIEDLPNDFDRLTARLDNAAKLQKAGVKVIISGNSDSTRSREARYNAGNAVANGLPYEEALKGLTLYPAQVFGLSELGSLAPGKLADVVVWSGDPLEPLSQPQTVLIDGKTQDLTSRPLKLRDRYLNPGAMPPAYTK